MHEMYLNVNCCNAVTFYKQISPHTKRHVTKTALATVPVCAH